MREEYARLYESAPDEVAASKRLFDILRILRKECPWDRVQTHESLRICMIEEAYEAVDAIENENMENLREELGDVMLQVIMNSIIAEEKEEFSLCDVINWECDKMIRRHPHIFSTDSAKSIDKVLEKWENVKSKEHGETNPSDRLNDVPNALPALLRANKVQKRTSQLGYDWESAGEAFHEVEKLFTQLRGDLASGNVGLDLIGQLLYAIVDVSRISGIDPEEALNYSTNHFVKKFTEVEASEVRSGRDMAALSLADIKNYGNDLK